MTNASMHKAWRIMVLLIFWALPLSTSAAALAGDTGDYVGEARCAGCHRTEQGNWAHTVHAGIFHLNPADELAARGCEACHGPGARHSQDPADKSAIIAFTHGRGLSSEVQNRQCLQCHQGRQRMFWAGSTHQTRDLACSDCHNPMAKFSSAGLLAKASVSETCFNCHGQQRTEFRKRSHMPLPEGKMSCSDCHNPHGSLTRALLRTDSVNTLCYDCHAEKRGPFLWEHAPVRRDCLSCHLPHGSSHESLLMVARPFLCQQCHANVSHPANLVTAANLPLGAMPDERAANRSCSNCHAQIHGSNHPSGPRLHR